MLDKNILQSFFFEIFGQLMPGFIVVFTIFCQFKTRDVAVISFPEFLRAGLSESSAVIWGCMIIASYLMGMFISAVMFKLEWFISEKTRFKLHFINRLNDLLFPEGEAHYSPEFRSQVLDIINRDTKLGIKSREDMNRNKSVIFSYMRYSIAEVSRSGSKGRYFERMSFVRTSSIPVFLVSLFLIFRITFEYDIIHTLLWVNLIAVFPVSYLYLKTQAIWYIQTTLEKYYTLANLKHNS